MTKRPMVGDLLIIEWVDSSMQHSQVGKDDYPVPANIRSVGWLVEQTDHFTTISRDDLGDGEHRGLLSIPKVCIKAHGVAT